MAPRRASAPAKKKQRRGSARAAPADAQGLAALPPDVMQIVASKVVGLDKFNSAMRQLAADSLWGLLGEAVPAAEPPPGRPAPPIEAVPKALHHEERFLSSRCRKLEYAAPNAKQLAEANEQARGDVNAAVPPQVYAEVRRLHNLGLAVSNAKSELRLTDKELAGLAKVEKDRGALGKARLLRLRDVLDLARAKHGSPEGLEAVERAAARQAQERKEKKRQAVQDRAKQLNKALKPRGATLKDSKVGLKLGRVAAWLRGSAKAPPERLLAYLELALWAEKHASFAGVRQSVLQSESRWMSFKVMYRDEGEGGSYFNDYFGKATKAAASLHESEEDDCLRLALQSWAKARGGRTAALTRPEVPASLRDAIAAALRQRIVSSVAMDIGMDYMSEGEEEEEEEEQPQGEGEGAAADLPSFFDRDFKHYLQVEAEAPTAEALPAWEAWVAKKLPRLAWDWAGGYEGVRLAEACPLAFKPPAAGQGGQGGQGGKCGSGGGDDSPVAHRVLFFVGTRKREDPASLYDGAVERLPPEFKQSTKLSADDAARLQTNLESRAGRWAERPQGCTCRVSLLAPPAVPGWVLEQAEQGQEGGEPDE